ncbi:response regulator transcription factor [Loigolactobacillus binensis]|uniref:Response regulator n=1 Tax=Loigolactobacillus binensis TaxID=2559922 RepID=A0ABW3EEU1_9LACO|nr:response regulator transcription factor [Loigolactobacillus binensis]
MIKIMIVDNHQIFRAGLKVIFEDQADYEVVAEAENGRVAVQKLASRAVDVVLLDIRLPVLDGIATLKKIKRQFPKIKVCMLSIHSDVASFNKAMALHADGFLLKSVSAEIMLQTVNDIMNGKMGVSPELVRRAVDYHNLRSLLSDADLDILTRIAHGEHSLFIAQELHFSERTIKSRLTNIYNKLGVDSRAGAVAKAMKFKLIEL